MEKISAWLFLLIAVAMLLGTAALGSILTEAAVVWVSLIAFAIIGILEVKAAK